MTLSHARHHEGGQDAELHSNSIDNHPCARRGRFACKGFGSSSRMDPLRPTTVAEYRSDADARVLEPLATAGKTAVIPPRTNRSSPRDYDRELYAARHLIENFFAKIKQLRAIVTRYEKTARNFLAAVQLVASVVWLN
jgi:transposase